MRTLELFVPHSPEQLTLIQSLKRSHIELSAGQTIIHEGHTHPQLYTLWSGWAFRYKTLADGRRQILNFLLPGDFIGVQQKMSDALTHGVLALSDVQLCVFTRDALWELHRAQPQMGFNITWLTAQEQSLVDDGLLSVGRRSAEERIAALLIVLFKRSAALMPDAGRDGVPFPLTQQHIADALGLSLVHTNKTLRKLERRGLHHLENGLLFLKDSRALAQTASLYGDGKPAPRPLV
ncbi:Crp/Fnr family transcriptional regulator [Sphaerotilaceae bacterium SBD11-9]